MPASHTESKPKTQEGRKPRVDTLACLQKKTESEKKVASFDYTVTRDLRTYYEGEETESCAHEARWAGKETDTQVETCEWVLGPRHSRERLSLWLWSLGNASLINWAKICFLVLFCLISPVVSLLVNTQRECCWISKHLGTFPDILVIDFLDNLLVFRKHALYVFNPLKST